MTCGATRGAVRARAAAARLGDDCGTPRAASRCSGRWPRAVCLRWQRWTRTRSAESAAPPMLPRSAARTSAATCSHALMISPGAMGAVLPPRADTRRAQGTANSSFLRLLLHCSRCFQHIAPQMKVGAMEWQVVAKQPLAHQEKACRMQCQSDLLNHGNALGSGVVYCSSGYSSPM